MHFAFWLYRKRKKVHFIDADAQASGSFWMSALGNVIPISKIIDANDLIEQLPVLAENYAFVA